LKDKSFDRGFEPLQAFARNFGFAQNGSIPKQGKELK